MINHRFVGQLDTDIADTSYDKPNQTHVLYEKNHAILATVCNLCEVSMPIGLWARTLA